ncbi:MAG TPA: universal stress protein [Polyangiaceae bacterium]|nr:universal stress protein [Polyangiaceae bacterium]
MEVCSARQKWHIAREAPTASVVVRPSMGEVGASPFTSFGWRRLALENPMIQRILAAIDDSARAPRVFATAIEYARAFGASVRLYHAFTVPPEFPPAAATSGFDVLPQHLRREAEQRLLALTSSVDDVSCETLIDERGPAWRAIMAAADDYDADLIVVGSHGFQGLDRLLGTNAGRVANSASRNVLVVHAANTI